jgi:hypothetical protein
MAARLSEREPALSSLGTKLSVKVAGRRLVGRARLCAKSLRRSGEKALDITL